MSNFQVAHVRRVVQESDVVPAVNQIEVHPYLCNEEVRAANAESGIVTEAWSPLAKGRVLRDPDDRCDRQSESEERLRR